MQLLIIIDDGIRPGGIYVSTGGKPRRCPKHRTTNGNTRVAVGDVYLGHGSIVRTVGNVGNTAQQVLLQTMNLRVSQTQVNSIWTKQQSIYRCSSGLDKN